MYLAQVLQYEYDREYDQQVNREEKLFNGNSKGTMALIFFFFFFFFFFPGQINIR